MAVTARPRRTKKEQDALELIAARLIALVTPATEDPDVPCHLGGVGVGRNEIDRDVKEKVRPYVASWILPYVERLINGDYDGLLRDYGRIDSPDVRRMLERLEEYR